MGDTEPLPMIRCPSRGSVSSRRSRVSMGKTNLKQAELEEAENDVQQVVREPGSRASLQRPATTGSVRSQLLTWRATSLHDPATRESRKLEMMYPPREHKTPSWLLGSDAAHTTRYANTPTPAATRWITHGQEGSAAFVRESDRLCPKSRYVETFNAEDKAHRETRLATRMERMRANESRVMAATFAEEQAKLAMQERRINGYRRQKLAYLEAVAQQAAQAL
eukprot:TRINITY_DN7979_c0_g1_i1.p2 TRINITY_DN7979_c0_g1~~TRINITY_DN7979_c0_g1_i1.p2  ORF type:complete len:222 (-),score=43.32 TRINITY_DN7979_c0_g1_i1:748-1413(-)